MVPPARNFIMYWGPEERQMGRYLHRWKVESRCFAESLRGKKRRGLSMRSHPLRHWVLRMRNSGRIATRNASVPVNAEIFFGSSRRSTSENRPDYLMAKKQPLQTSGIWSLQRIISILNFPCYWISPKNIWQIILNSEYTSRRKPKNRYALFDKAERICYGISGNLPEILYLWQKLHRKWRTDPGSVWML